MADTGKALLVEVTRELAKRGLRRARQAIGKSSIPSRTLQRSMLVLVRPGRADLVVPQYWALYVHDGRRGGFGPRRGQFLIWWKDPKKDPRLPGGVTPARASQLRHLTPSEFKKALEEHQEALDAGRSPDTVIVRRVRRSTRGTRFFENDGGMRGTMEDAHDVAGLSLRAALARKLKEEIPFVGLPGRGSFDFGMRKAGTATVRLG